VAVLIVEAAFVKIAVKIVVGTLWWWW
jgi:hypothetical protein